MQGVSQNNSGSVLASALVTSIDNTSHASVDATTIIDAHIPDQNNKWSPDNFSRNEKEFRDILKKLHDTSGNVTYEERLNAYTSLFEMGVKGKLTGMSRDDQNLFEKGLFESDVGIRATKIQQDGVAAHLAAKARGENSAVARLEFVSGLSDIDQKTNFSVNENSFDMAGNRHYANFDSYRDQLVSNAIYEYTWAQSANDKDLLFNDGAKGDFEGVIQGLKKIDSQSLGRNWGSHLLGLIANNGALKSSSGISNANTPFSLTMPMSYNPGSIMTLLA